jgi:uncharacterized protein (TIGR03663 family)
MMKNKLSIKIKRFDFILWLILGLGLFLRLYLLDLKPPHFDEGINGWFVDQLISQGFYKYDPTNYHGPFHFYLLFFFKILFGRNLYALRLPSVLFGLASVFLLTKFQPYIGRFASRTAAFFAAISPAMIFYSRYSIHESELLFFSMLSVLGFFRFQTQKDRVSLWQIGIGLAGMIVTKETFLIHIICFVIALACVSIYEKIFPKVGSIDKNSIIAAKFTLNDIYIVASVSILIIASLYSGFFMNSRGLTDFIKSFALWFQTGEQGNGQQKPFIYWLTLMWRYEWASLVGLAACIRLFWPIKRQVRIIGVFGVGVFLAYSLVPYKTPWCILNLLWPFLLVLGYTLSEVQVKPATFLFILLLGCIDIRRSYELNFKHFTDENEPYVYVQTFQDIMTINQKVRNILRRNLSIRSKPFNILLESSWPIPWLFGDLSQGNFAGRPIPPNPDAMFILADGSLRDELEKRLKHTYFKQSFRLRSAQSESIAYFDAELFKEEFSVDATLFKPHAIEPLKSSQGLIAKFFTNEKWVGEPAHVKHVPSVDFVWSESERPLPAPFGVLFEGEILIPRDEPIVFALTSDDGSILEIDDQVIIDNSGVHSEKSAEHVVSESQGWHKIVVRYSDFGGGMMARLMWKLGNGFEPINQESFRPRHLP